MYIDSLTLQHVKAFESLHLDFARPNEASGRYAGMNIFVGGNSSGKSTLLKALAMVASGPVVANQQLISPTGWISRNQTKATIEAKIVWDSKLDTFRIKGGLPKIDETFPAGLTFEADQEGGTPSLKEKYFQTQTRAKVRSAERGPWHTDSDGWLLGAYGPMRRLTGSSTDALRYALAKGKLSSCVTLFREDAALSESETWLKQEHARALERESQASGQAGQPRSAPSLSQFVQDFLNDGLLPTGFRISRITVDNVYMTTPNGGELPMRDLSDGCRSAYALMVDIIHNMALTYDFDKMFCRNHGDQIIINKPGVVLIDELEAHLHPSWQRTICDWLKTRFPAVQFFIATHSPLIVQAADLGGIFVLPLPGELGPNRKVRRLEPHEEERIRFGRAEKVLLGEAFGLKHTWSVQADKLVQEWERLAARREARDGLSPSEQLSFDTLSDEVTLVFDQPPAQPSSHA